MTKNKYGNVYEIKLSNGKYVYVCWMKEFSFGNIQIISLKSYNRCKQLVICRV